MTFTIDDTKVGGTADLSNFPVLMMDSNFTNNTFANTDNGGGDLRFSSDEAGATQLSCYVESYVTATKKAVVYVNVPTLDGDAATVIHVWGWKGQSLTQPAVGASYGRNSTFVSWDDVYLFNSSGTDVCGNYDMTPSATLTYGAGQVGNAVTLTSGQYLSNSTAGACKIADNAAFTLVALMKPSATAGQLDIIAKYRNSPGAFNYEVAIQQSGKFCTNTQNDAWIKSNTTVSTTAYKLYGASFNGSNTVTFTLNGVSDGTPAENAVVNSGADIGAWIGQNGASSGWFTGILNQVWLNVDTALSVNWILTMYNNLFAPSTFGTAADVSAPTTTVVDLLGGFIPFNR